MSSGIDIKRFLAEQGSLAASRTEVVRDFRQTFAGKLPADCLEFVAKRIEQGVAAMPFQSDLGQLNFELASHADAAAVQQLINELRANTQHWCLQATKAWVELWAALNSDDRF